MNFASDNVTGASAPVLRAIVEANEGAMPAYGADPVTARALAALEAAFERPVAASLVATGTAANALALSLAVPPYGSCLCHAQAHVIDDECGAPEFYTHGAKLVGLPGTGAKLRADDLDGFLAGLTTHEKQMPPAAVSISQVTECGLAYAPDEVRAISEVCRRHGLKLHMDGARFANAVAALGCSPAEATWRAGVDLLSFGATKNGALAAEAVVVFDEGLASSLRHRRKRAGHTLSKGRFLAAQIEAYLAGGHWLANARHANRMAGRLARGLAGLPGVRLAWEPQANEVFPILPRATDAALRRAGAAYHPWSPASLAPGQGLGPDECLVRLVASFATTEEEVDRFLDAACAAA